MSDTTHIQWTDATWNPVTGCKEVSPGCANCYAARLTATRLAQTPKYKGLAVIGPDGRPRFTGAVRCHEDALANPLRWRTPRMIFVNSTSDLFHEDVPFEFIDKVFAVMALASQHCFQVLTKRPERMAVYLSNKPHRGGPTCDRIDMAMQEFEIGRKFKTYPGPYCARQPLSNVWLGTSAEDQPRLDERLPHLRRCQAAVRFLSLEPLLGPIELPDRYIGKPEWPAEIVGGIDWVIVGGESGRNARRFEWSWARSIRDQCRAAGVPFFLKQAGSHVVTHCHQCGRDIGRRVLGGWVNICGPSHAALVAESQWIAAAKGDDPAEWPEDLRVREFPETPTP